MSVPQFMNVVPNPVPSGGAVTLEVTLDSPTAEPQEVNVVVDPPLLFPATFTIGAGLQSGSVMGHAIETAEQLTASAALACNGGYTQSFVTILPGAVDRDKAFAQRARPILKGLATLLTEVDW